MLNVADDVAEVGIALGRYDPARALTIDPTIAYAGYIGGTKFDQATSVAVDSVGAAYVAGYTQSTPLDLFPVSVGPNTTFKGGLDAFVAKVKPDGSGVVYAGYIGGNLDETTFGVAVDGLGSAYVVGRTASSPLDMFPVAVGPNMTYNGNQDGFIAKVTPDGLGLTYAGYIGGTQLDSVTGVAVDASGAAYVAGLTQSSELQMFPLGGGPSGTYKGNGDAFVAKVLPNGSGLAYSGYIGGSQPDSATGVAVDSSGAAYVVGNTSSSGVQGFPLAGGLPATYNGAGDAFVAKVSVSGSSLVYSGYIGGTDFDAAAAVAVDVNGAAYLVGTTVSTPVQLFPISGGPRLQYGGGFHDGFITKVNPGGAGLGYSGYIGGAMSDDPRAVAVDAAGAAYVAGYTTSSGADGFPLAGSGLSATYAGNTDAFVSKVTPSGTGFEYSGYIGGSKADQGLGIAVDANGNAYVVGDTSSAGVDGFPLAGGLSATQKGLNDAFVAKVGTATGPPPTCSPRPRVVVSVSRGALGVLNVTLQAGSGTISSVQFGPAGRPFTNASIAISGGPAGPTSSFTYTPGVPPAAVQFTVTSLNRNAATTVPMIVTDGCGPWTTFVGGGAQSF